MVPFTFSRVTLFSLLLGLLVASGTWLWYVDRNDSCARYLAGDTSLPSSQVVEIGSRMAVVPCSYWIVRMPLSVQVVCLFNAVLGVLFVLSGLTDLQNWLHLRKQMKQTR